MGYVVAPDTEGAFLDFVVPGDVITQGEQEEITQTCIGMIPPHIPERGYDMDEPILHDCPYCPGQHYDVEQCPLKPEKE